MSCLTAFVWVCTCLGATGWSEGPGDWVGKQVFTRPGTELKVEGKVVATDRWGDAYEVVKAEGGRLYLRNDHQVIPLWVEADRVMLLDDAILYYTDEIKTKPLETSLFASRGHAWLAKGETEIALADFNDAIKLDPKNEWALIGRGDTFVSRGNYREFTDYTSALRINPRSSLPYMRRASNYIKAKDYGAAIQNLTEALRIDPRDPNAFYLRAWALISNKKVEQAIKDYEAAIQISPGYAVLFWHRGHAWSEKGDLDKAIADYSEAIRLDPNPSGYYRSRAKAFLKVQQYDRAIKDIDKLLLINSSDGDALVDRAEAYRAKKQYAKVLESLNKAVEVDPENLDYKQRLAWFLATCPDNACRDGKRALELGKLVYQNRQNAIVFDILAACYAELGDFEHAVEFEEASNRLANVPEALSAYEARLALYKDKKPYREP